MFDFIAIDFETASSSNDSACSIGLAYVDNLEIVDTKYFLIQPPTLVFNKTNIDIHGIKPSDVKNSPKFPEIWEEIKEHFTVDNLVIAHNARFDMSVLKCCFEYYKIDMPEFFYACSIPISTKICGSDIGKKLSARADFFKIEIDQHHNALSDAITCAKIVIETVKKSRQKTFKTFVKARAIHKKSFIDLKPSRNLGKVIYDQIEYSELVATNENINSNHFFHQKNVVLTGTLTNLSRSEAIQKLVNVGAVMQKGVVKTTQILIVGTRDENLFNKSELSAKEIKAHELIEKGYAIEILNEQQFLEKFE